MMKVQDCNEVEYKIALKFLNILLRNGIITPLEYEKIDELNRKTFAPEYAEVYV